MGGVGAGVPAAGGAGLPAPPGAGAPALPAGPTGAPLVPPAPDAGVFGLPVPGFDTIGAAPVPPLAPAALDPAQFWHGPETLNCESGSFDPDAHAAATSGNRAVIHHFMTLSTLTDRAVRQRDAEIPSGLHSFSLRLLTTLRTRCP
jgi:hypothetical protein